MSKPIAFGLTALALLAASPALAQSSADFGFDPRGAELAPYLQCVPYAREVSGIRIYGDAHTWWQQAEGRYATGHAPKVGAVLAFRPHRSMQLGHVATVSRVVDGRRVLLDHANWSPIDGRRGQIERDVLAVDVSPANDWSAVRVWYHPLGGLGKTEWPVEGFIYSDRTRSAPVRVAQGPTRLKSSRQFLSAFNEFSN
ncbi:CHAP domain-containing protein [Erythrobacter sp. QSSC1-22B]|uniref:CHAP domain-containing protein n=1 Tax=Erythrobacter sp. QSSC1-22B TaxID=1860125 RepID=UPI0009F1BF52|nr:CHAP domain-containing protein [Erythrobacter sp. QSSC1-22B]